MYEKKIPENLECGLNVSIKVIGGKWKARIIDCIHQGIKRPSALHRAIEGTSPRLIRMQLKELENYGIVRKQVVSTLPMRIEYSLTRLGITLLPVLEVLDKWGEKHRERILGASMQDLSQQSAE
jgi:DNA-binding HxlR family transcriptional regulator